MKAAAGLDRAVAMSNGTWGIAVDRALLERLDLKPGSMLCIGSLDVEIRAIVSSEPDRLGGRFVFGPRVFMTESRPDRNRTDPAGQSGALALPAQAASAAGDAGRHQTAL